MKTHYSILGNQFLLDSVSSIFDEVSNIDFNQSVNELVDILDEDLLMISFDDGSVIDVGWYPAFESDGEFKVQLIKNANWDNPEYSVNVSFDKINLVEKIRVAISMLNR